MQNGTGEQELHTDVITRQQAVFQHPIVTGRTGRCVGQPAAEL